MQVTLEIVRAHLLAISEFAAKNDIRYYLNGVYVESYKNTAFIVATNGTALAVMRSEQSRCEAQDVSFIIPNDLVKSAKRGSLAVIQVMYDTETKMITLIDAGRQFAARAEDGRFPDWRRVLPREVSGNTANYDPALVDMVVGAAKHLGMKHAVPYIYQNGTSAGLAILQGHSDFAAVLMPYKHKQNKEDWIPPFPSEARWAAPPKREEPKPEPIAA